MLTNNTNCGINNETGAVEIPAMTPDIVPTPVKRLGPADFPFKVSDIKYWVVKRKDGVVAKYILTTPNNGTQQPAQTHPYNTGNSTVQYSTHQPRLSDWCKHTPDEAGLPIVEEDGIKLYIADAIGLREKKFKFDYILDNGNVLSTQQMMPTLEGDPDLVKSLQKYVLLQEPVLLKIDWPDREAPPLEFEFWEDYVSQIEGKVVTACQGGHGRSGTSLVCMMMALIPDYTPYAAICHLRALHCPRAIESKVQHEYIGQFGAWLGRVDDVAKVSEVKNFKEAFLALDLAGAKKYQEQLRNREKVVK